MNNLNNRKIRYSPVFQTLKYLESECSCRGFIRAISLFEYLQAQFSLVFHAANLLCVIAQDVNSLITLPYLRFGLDRRVRM